MSLVSMVEKSFPVGEFAIREVVGASYLKSSANSKCVVVAAERLCCETRSQPFDVNDIVSQMKRDNSENYMYYVGTTNRGFLEAKTATEECSKNWQRRLNLAPDIHSSNVHLDAVIQNNKHESLMEKSYKFILRITKNVQCGDELLLWFSDEILALIDMPFLTPKNITGHKKYQCHKCEENFEYPNPLKVHILLSCGRESLTKLWSKLDRSISNNLTPLMPKAIIKQCPSILDRPSSASILPLMIKPPDLPRCISEPPISAFLPYKKHIAESTIGKLALKRSIDSKILSLTTPTQPLNLSVMSHDVSDVQRLQIQRPWVSNILELRLSRSLEELSGNYAADVELFASSWGKMKQGHLCVYCGKVYSRKYGLKIHIRTHTGYKPLKCKFCARPFGDPSNLNKHVRLHASGLAPYACALCGKVLVRRRDLERHLKSQHSIEDDNCSITEIKSD